MKRYELAFLITPDLPEEEAKGFQQKINSQIQEEGGVLDEGNILLKRRLAYPINKKTEAYLASTTFQLNPDKIASLEGKVKAEKQILRYILLVVKKTRKMAPRRVRPTAIKSKVTITEKVLTPEEKKVELQEIGKKLDEILDEPK
jgi:small subunit ribosomal protein S6